MLSIIILQKLAQLLENNSKQMQSSTLTANYAITSISMLEIHLQELRSDEELARIFEEVEKMTGVTHHKINLEKRMKMHPLTCRTSWHILKPQPR